MKKALLFLLITTCALAQQNTFPPSGTGGSILVIGSAAGVALMGLEKVDFIWYVKKISWVALISYFAGLGFLIGQHALLNIM